MPPKKIKIAWRNLLKERCPKCECILNWSEEQQKFICALNDGQGGFFSCDFTCTKKTIEYVKKNGLKDIDEEDIFSNEITT